jgi:S-adenosylmethionine hydrolase
MISPPTIALLTDFGLDDWYVGTMHGVIRRIAPQAAVINLCHNIPSQNVRSAAFALECSCRYFPDRTVFCCVVDPGVGTGRSVICATDGRYTYVAPDNGLLTLAAHRAGAEWFAWRATNARYFLPDVSATFQGRDIFAPLSAHLAKGVPIGSVGEAIDRIERFAISEVRISTDDRNLKGEVAHIDRFGNLITNIEEKHLESIDASPPVDLMLDVKGRKITGLAKTFADRAVGEPLFYWGSSGYLEIAINQGCARDEFAAALQTPVLLYLT